MNKTLKALTLSAGLLSGLASAATEIEWWHAMGGSLGDTVNAMATEFNASQSDYKITPIYKGGYEETITAGISAFRAGEAPAIIQIFDAGAATIINAKGAALSVEDILVDNGYEFDINSYVPGVRYFYADANDKMIGMPFNSSTPVLYYNKAMLADAGVKPPKTWEEFETTAEKLKQKGYVALAQSHTPWIFFENFHSRHDLQMADKDNGFSGLPNKVMYNNKHLKMHLEHVKAWKDAGYYGYYGRVWGDNENAFVKKEVAMWIGSSGSFGGLKTSADFDFGTSYLPYWESINKDAGTTFIGGAALFAMAGHTDKEYEAVAAFFNYLTKPETQYFWHRETGYVPITNAAYNLAKDDGYYAANPDAEVGIKQLSLDEGEWTKGYRLGFYVQTRESIYREMDRIMSGETTVEAALKAIETDANRNLERFARTVK
ncbi:extracellular solute-binding protein [Reinekea marinisedimentorum]|uniref:sn-glycerol-3-phosphate-binding periplasmic protein UgpB n=1 Tax=Reinekea marinisedimentorum TaxID=230495 RepID=A0A4R3I278_9GAMM|nr:extracellular solute-binding protein [Reinekea marinisedimentorum]TCS38745.1 sn-glycerol 3-phosphate transport system substrate-binding protein [Reinekea marinisedimentorum]